MNNEKLAILIKENYEVAEQHFDEFEARIEAHFDAFDTRIQNNAHI